MTDLARTAAGTPQSRADCLTALRRMGDEQGYFKPLGAHHWALFNEDGQTLLVTFETLEAVCVCAPGEMPFYHNLATHHGWSHLSLIAEGRTWFRDAEVYRFFDGLVDDGFFDGYDRVVFYGAEMAGYAAAAFSVAAPGATVLVLSPRATLDPGRAGWDGRERGARRLDFTSRYGFAPDMTEGADRVFIVHDPRVTEDAMHAALFHGRHVHRLRTPFLGASLEASLRQMEVLPKQIHAAMEGRLTPALFFTLWRVRRNFGAYLRQVLARAAATGHPRREAMVCRSVTSRLRAPGFRRRLADLEASFASQTADQAADQTADQTAG